MGDGLSLRFTYVADRQPAGAGKFEEFICRVPGFENLEAGPSHDLMRT
jgi:hypothetical protein